MKSSIYAANPNTPSGSSTLDGERIISLHDVAVGVSEDFIDNLVIPSRNEPFLGRLALGASRKQNIYRYVT